MTTISIRQHSSRPTDEYVKNFEGKGLVKVSISSYKCGGVSTSIRGLHLTNLLMRCIYGIVAIFCGKIEQFQTNKREYIWMRSEDLSSNHQSLDHLYSSATHKFCNQENVWGIYQEALAYQEPEDQVEQSATYLDGGKGPSHIQDHYFKGATNVYSIYRTNGIHDPQSHDHKSQKV